MNRVNKHLNETGPRVDQVARCDFGSQIDDVGDFGVLKERPVYVSYVAGDRLVGGCSMRPRLLADLGCQVDQ